MDTVDDMDNVITDTEGQMMIIQVIYNCKQFCTLINKQDLNYYSNHSNGFSYQTARRTTRTTVGYIRLAVKALADVTYYGISKGYTDIASSYWGERLATQIIDLQTGDYYVTAQWIHHF